MNEYLILFEDMDSIVSENCNVACLPLHIIGRAALELAGLPERGTKDVDALEDAMRIDAISADDISRIEKMLKAEFGKGSPGDRRHGLYLDLVGKGGVWLPKNPCFVNVMRYKSIEVSRLQPVDVCVSKTFSNFKGRRDRAQDRADIIEALQTGLVEAFEYVGRVDESLPMYEMHAEAPDVFPRVIKFLEDEIIPNFCEEPVILKYRIPSWMENL